MSRIAITTQKVIRNLAIASAVTLPLVPLTTQGALADKANFWVYNTSSNVISELYMSHSGRNSWDNDILGSNILDSGANVQVFFSDASDNCLYDIQAIFADGQVVEDYQVDVCSNSEYTFYDQ